MNLPIYTNSEIKTWRRCPRLHWLEYELGFRPIVKAAPLELGTLLHVGLEAWLHAMKRRDDAGALDAALDAIGASVKPDTDPVLVVQAEELMLGYHCRWADADLEVLEVEVQFEADVCDPVLGEPLGLKLSGKLDGIVRVGGEVFILEHKTTSFDFAPGSHYWERTRLDSQIGLYFLGARALGYQPAGCLYDVIGKPKNCEPQKATPSEKRRYRKDGQLYANQREYDETPDEYRGRLSAAISAEPGAFYARAPVMRLRREIEAAEQDLVSTLELMAQAKKIGLSPRNVDSCWDFARRCEFFDCCSTGALPEVGEQFRRAETKHEELA